MHTIIPPARSNRTAAAEPASLVRTPHYECDHQPQGMKITVFVPAVDATDIDIASIGPDLVVTAPKTHVVRVNWRALHLESAQQDYVLRLRLGTGFDFDALHAELRNGVLTINVPRRRAHPDAARLRRVA